MSLKDANFYAGNPPLNRLSFQRPKGDKLNAYLPDAKYMVFKDGQPLVRKGEIGTPIFLNHGDVTSLVGSGYGSPPAEVTDKRAQKAFEVTRLDAPVLIFLGIDERNVPKNDDLLNPTGVPYFAVDASGTSFEAPEGAEFANARQAASVMKPWEAGVFALAAPIVDWNTRNKFCPGCGSKNYSLWAGWKLNCSTHINPVEGKTCFSTKGVHNFSHPRTDPVIIMAILDETGDKILLGRQKSWPDGFYSCLAGFIEPGETFEEAVRREVLEEAGIDVGPVSYSCSQPWPYPANLMVGCFGRAQSNQTVRLDLDNELDDAQWFPRSVLANVLKSDKGSHLTKEDYQKLEDAFNKVNEDETSGQKLTEMEAFKALTRVPPDTAIAGVLIRQWALSAHAVDLVSKM